MGVGWPLGPAGSIFQTASEKKSIGSERPAQSIAVSEGDFRPFGSNFLNGAAPRWAFTTSLGSERPAPSIAVSHADFQPFRSHFWMEPACQGVDPYLMDFESVCPASC